MNKIACIGLGSLAAAMVLAGSVRAEWTLRHLRTVEGFQVPECVVIDPDSGVGYVSNIVALPIPGDTSPYWAEDGNGFISRLKPDGQMDVPQWKKSTPELPLNSPKGMCILRGRLWVNDVTQVASFPLAGDRPGRRRPIEGALKLNDMASDGRAVYASDMEQGVVYRITRQEVTKLKAPAGVNGITFFQGKMFAVSRTEHDVWEMDPAGRSALKPFGVAEHFSGLDGIEVLDDGTFLISDIAGGKVSAIEPDRHSVRTLVELESPADIGLDRQRMLLYVPLFKKDQVEVYQIEK